MSLVIQLVIEKTLAPAGQRRHRSALESTFAIAAKVQLLRPVFEPSTNAAKRRQNHGFSYARG
jgi:hypothetical protein